MGSKLALSDRDTFRWWFLPSWLGLDAPVVVVVWTLAIGSTYDLAAPWQSYAILAATVWAIYLADRLIDVSRCQDWSSATARLGFGRRFWLVFVICLGLCLIAGGNSAHPHPGSSDSTRYRNRCRSGGLLFDFRRPHILPPKTSGQGIGSRPLLRAWHFCGFGTDFAKLDHFYRAGTSRCFQLPRDCCQRCRI